MLFETNITLTQKEREGLVEVLLNRDKKSIKNWSDLAKLLKEGDKKSIKELNEYHIEISLDEICKQMHRLEFEFTNPSHAALVFYMAFFEVIFESKGESAELKLDLSTNTLYLCGKLLAQSDIDFDPSLYINRLCNFSNRPLDTNSSSRLININDAPVGGIHAHSLGVERLYHNTTEGTQVGSFKGLAFPFSRASIVHYLCYEKLPSTQGDMVRNVFLSVFGGNKYQKCQSEAGLNLEDRPITALAKQVLIPDGDGGYLSVSPMINPHIASVLNPIRFDKSKLLDADVSISGGTKPGNVSYLNSLHEGKMIDFNMSFPSSKNDEVKTLLYHLNSGIVPLYSLRSEITELRSMANKIGPSNEGVRNKLTKVADLVASEILLALHMAHTFSDKITYTPVRRLLGLDEEKINETERRDLAHRLIRDSFKTKALIDASMGVLTEAVKTRVLEEL